MTYQSVRERKNPENQIPEPDDKSYLRSRLIFQVLFWTLTAIGLFFAFF